MVYIYLVLIFIILYVVISVVLQMGKNLEKATEILNALEIGDKNVEALLVKYGLK